MLNGKLRHVLQLESVPVQKKRPAQYNFQQKKVRLTQRAKIMI